MFFDCHHQPIAFLSASIFNAQSSILSPFSIFSGFSAKVYRRPVKFAPPSLLAVSLGQRKRTLMVER
jgi:hypothetical protein